MIITVSLVTCAFGIVLLMKVMNRITFKCTRKIQPRNHKQGIDSSLFNSLLPDKHMSVLKIQANPFTLFVNLVQKNLKLSLLVITSLSVALIFLLIVSFIRSQMIEYKIEQYQSHFRAKENPASKPDPLMDELDNKSSKFTLVLSYDICKLINDQFFEDYILIFISLPITVLIYMWNAFKCSGDHEYYCRFAKLKIKRKNRDNNFSTITIATAQLNSIEQSSLSIKSESSSSGDLPVEVNRFSAISNSICYTCSVLHRRLNLFGTICSCNLKLPVPINPFSKRNRFITAVIYAAYTYNILKIFEYLIVGDKHIQASNRLIEKSKDFIQNMSLQNASLASLNKNILLKYDEASQQFAALAERGILMDLLKQICNVFIIGLRYYPVLLCVELKRKSKFCYFITSLYVLLLFVSYIYMNIFCLLSASNAIKEANSKLFHQSQSQFGGLLGLGQMRRIKMANETNKTVSYRIKRDEIPMPSSNRSHFDLDAIKNTLFLDNIMYEKFLFYAVLCLITFNIVFEFMLLMKHSIERTLVKVFATNKPKLAAFYEAPRQAKQANDFKHELNYTMQIFKENAGGKPVSFVRHLFEKHVYKNHRDFRYPKQFINTQIIAFVLLYYITCIIIRKSKLIVNLSSNILILLINFIFQSNASNESSSFIMNSKAQLNALIQSLFDHIGRDIITACCLTSGIYMIQLFLGIRNYQRHVLNAYKGIYVDIPSPRSFSNTKLASSSLHYR